MSAFRGRLDGAGEAGDVGREKVRLHIGDGIGVGKLKFKTTVYELFCVAAGLK